MRKVLHLRRFDRSTRFALSRRRLKDLPRRETGLIFKKASMRSKSLVASQRWQAVAAFWRLPFASNISALHARITGPSVPAHRRCSLHLILAFFFFRYLHFFVCFLLLGANNKIGPLTPEESQTIHTWDLYRVFVLRWKMAATPRYFQMFIRTVVYPAKEESRKPFRTPASWACFVSFAIAVLFS